MQLAFSISWVSVIKPLSDKTGDVDGMNMFKFSPAKEYPDTIWIGNTS